MKRLGLVLSILAALGLGPWAPLLAQVGPPNTIQCNQVAALTAGPIVITQIQAGLTGKIITICGWHITNTGASGTFSLSYGTGTNCGTGTTTIVPPLNVTSSAPSADHVDFASLSIPAGNALCITPSVATIAGVVFIGQF